jgi:hypothetical protein
MQVITTVGLDIAKSVFQVHGIELPECPLLGVKRTSVQATIRVVMAKYQCVAL